MEDFESGPEHESAGWNDLPDPLANLFDSWYDDDNVEYWVWDGDRLVPASAEERACLREEERTESALRRLKLMQEEERRKARRRKLLRPLLATRTWCSHCVDMVVRRLRERWHPGQARQTEGLRAERSTTKR
jgi:hypothetical protein